MAKGVKMDRAFDPVRNLVCLASQIAPSQKAGKQCDGCCVPVEHVNGHVINGDDERLRRDVPAFFRLPSRGGISHLPDCKYTPIGGLRLVVHQSDAIEDALNPFSLDPQNGKYVFRMNIPSQELLRVELEGRSKQGSKSSRDLRIRTEIVWSGERIAPYCRSAIGLARLWAFMEQAENREELREAVSLRHEGRSIRWEDFFFSLDRYKKLLRHAEKRRKHPVAVFVEVRAEPKRCENGTYKIDCVAKEIAGAPSEARVSPTIFTSESLAVLFDRRKRYIVFGDWSVARARETWVSEDGLRKIDYINVKINVFNEAQFHVVDLPDEGEDQ